ncbi:hypothetical protein B0H19DRAFT_1297047 [Mycena capillaripes]|nr:hypothetical protein B0H19DRAFT_1297047 [Mycena capillaripes]
MQDEYDHEALSLVQKPSFIGVMKYIRPSLTDSEIPADRPNEWELMTEELAFMKLEGRHTGANIGKAVVETIDHYGMSNKVGWITSDGASVNCSAACTVEKMLDTNNWKAKEHDMIKGEINSDEVTKVLSTLGGGDEGGGAEDEPEMELEESDWTAGDALGKILALIKQIRMSPQARVFFKECCQLVDIPELQLLLWVRMRWASLYKCLDCILKLRKAIKQFVLTADATRFQRSEIRSIVTISSLNKNGRACRPAEVRDALFEGVRSLQKWFNRGDTTSSTYFICMVLDPTIKDAYFKFDKHYADTPADNAPQLSTATVADPVPFQRCGSSFLLDAVKSAQKNQQAVAQPHNELKSTFQRNLSRRPMCCTGGVTTLHTQHYVVWPTTIWQFKGLPLLLSALFLVEISLVHDFVTG